MVLLLVGIVAVRVVLVALLGRRILLVMLVVWMVVRLADGCRRSGWLWRLGVHGLIGWAASLCYRRCVVINVRSWSGRREGGRSIEGAGAVQDA